MIPDLGDPLFWDLWYFGVTVRHQQLRDVVYRRASELLHMELEALDDEQRTALEGVVLHDPVLQHAGQERKRLEAAVLFSAAFRGDLS